MSTVEEAVSVPPACGVVARFKGTMCSASGIGMETRSTSSPFPQFHVSIVRHGCGAAPDLGEESVKLSGFLQVSTDSLPVTEGGGGRCGVRQGGGGSGCVRASPMIFQGGLTR